MNNIYASKRERKIKINTCENEVIANSYKLADVQTGSGGGG